MGSPGHVLRAAGWGPPSAKQAFSHILPTHFAIRTAWLAPEDPTGTLFWHGAGGGGAGAGAAESRGRARVSTCSVEPLPFSRPLPNGLLPPPLCILCPPLPHASPSFQVGAGHSQGLLSTGDFQIIFFGRFWLLLKVVWPLKTALQDRDPISISAPLLPSFMSVGILALSRVYFLGIRGKYLPLEATVEINMWNVIRAANAVDRTCHPYLNCCSSYRKDRSAGRKGLLY